MKVAYQGEPGAYSEAAVFAHFGAAAEPIPFESFDQVFDAVNEKVCERGLVPIENSVAGSIHRNYDLLLQHTLSITGEHHLRVQHCLIGHPGSTLSDIRHVYSHPQALAQCDRYLRSLPGVVAEAAYDTAGSVKLVKNRGDHSEAAIASARAAGVYDMTILAHGIEDNTANYTRFLEIARDPVLAEGNTKTSIVFSLGNKPGVLFKALAAFALREIDLVKIESRPLVGKPWDYYFYIDMAGSIADEVVRRALENLNEYTLMLRVLGSYPRHNGNMEGDGENG